MEAAEGWARAAGLGLVALDTGAANARARRFYERLGYREESVKLVKELAPRREGCESTAETSSPANDGAEG
jgi:ribosomal protein S18 acetylase RimI-like enzyme